MRAVASTTASHQVQLHEMDYWKSDKYFGVTRHNSFLAVLLVKAAPVVLPTVITLPPINFFGHKLDASKVSDAVQAGIRKANHTFHTQYQAIRIHYVEDDTPPETFYADMVFNLIEQIQAGASLQEVKYKYADL